MRNFYQHLMTKDVHSALMQTQPTLFKDKVMEARLPNRLKNKPLAGVLFELRFSSDLPLTNILPGLLYGKLNCESIDKTAHADIPESMRIQNESLSYVPTVRMNWGDYVVLVADKALVLECRIPYKGWEDFKEKILKLISTVSDSGLPLLVSRFSLKYIDILDMPEDGKLDELLNFNFSLGEVGLNYSATQFRTEKNIDDVIVIIQFAGSARADFEDGNSKSGFLIDTDTIYTVNKEMLGSLIEAFPDKITKLHDVNKKLFFSYLTDKGLAALEPEYE